MSINIKKPLNTDNQSTNRVVQDIYNSLNEIIEAVNSQTKSSRHAFRHKDTTRIFS